jgi:lipopolysaccharide export system protein LptA
LSLGLKGELGAVDRATFRRAFKVTDGDLVATAEEGVYDAAAETLELRSPTGAARPKVIDPGFEIEANEIDANLSSDAIKARSEGRQKVESFLTPSTATSSDTAKGAGLFEAGKAVTGTSVSLEYSAAEGLAVYDGEVYLRQGGSSLRAAHVEINDASGDLTAKGSVRSTLALAADNTPDAPPAKPVEIDAATMNYSDTKRTAEYGTDVVFRADTGEETRADQLVLTLEAAARRLSTAVATAAAGNEVRVSLLEGRQTRGTRVTYNAATDEYVVVGKPAVFVAPTPDQGPGECSVGSGTELRFARTSRTAVVLNEGGAVGVMSSAKCAAVIK